MYNKNESKLYLFGAGGWGRTFVNGKRLREYEKYYDKIVFWDNNPLLIGKEFNKFEIDNHIWEKNLRDGLIITSGYWEEIYKDCILHKIEPIGIYDGDRDTIYSYREMCIYYKKTYQNIDFINYHAEREAEINYSVEQFKNGNGTIFENMTQVAIMLSNLCNYANIHPKCPASLVKDKEIMSSKNVYKILDELAQENFNGIICFHAYNEPTMDPRLFLFIRYAKEKMENVRIMIYSNGYYLNKTMMNEYEEIGADVLIVTGYGNEEFERLISLDEGKVPYQVLWGNLDNRLNYYDETCNMDCGICRASFFQITIFSNGDIGTCCLDYKHPYNLGNIFETTLKEAVNSPERYEFQEKLLEGNRRMFPICQGCGWNL